MAVTLADLRRELNALGKKGLLEAQVRDAQWKRDWERMGRLLYVLFDPERMSPGYLKSKYEMLSRRDPETMKVMNRLKQSEQAMGSGAGQEDAEEKQPTEETLLTEDVFTLEKELQEKVFSLRESLGLKAECEALEFLKSDSIQLSLWKKCWNVACLFPRERQREMAHDAFTLALTEDLLKYHADQGVLTFFFEASMYHRMGDLVRKRLGRYDKEAAKAAREKPDTEKTEEQRRKEFLQSQRNSVSISASLDAPLREEIGGKERTYTLGERAQVEEIGYQEFELEEIKAKAVELMAADQERLAQMLNVNTAEILFRADRARGGGARLLNKLAYRRVFFTVLVIDLQHSGEPPLRFRYPERIENAVEGEFADYCLEGMPENSLIRIYRSPIVEEYYLPLKEDRAKGDTSPEARLVGTVKMSAGWDFMGKSKGTYSPEYNKYYSEMRSWFSQMNLI